MALKTDDAKRREWVENQLLDLTDPKTPRDKIERIGYHLHAIFDEFEEEE
jgi:hypothetical protein